MVHLLYPMEHGSGAASSGFLMPWGVRLRPLGDDLVPVPLPILCESQPAGYVRIGGGRARL